MSNIKNEIQLLEMIKRGELSTFKEYTVISYENTNNGISFISTKTFSNKEEQRDFILSLPTNTLLIISAPSNGGVEFVIRGKELKARFSFIQLDKIKIISFEKLKAFVPLEPLKKSSFEDFVNGLTSIGEDSFKNYPYPHGCRNRH